MRARLSSSPKLFSLTVQADALQSFLQNFHTNTLGVFSFKLAEAMGQEESHNEEMDLARIHELCVIFMKECPSGALHLHEFKKIFGVPSSSVEESLFIETIFNSFDTNKVKRQNNLSL